MRAWRGYMESNARLMARLNRELQAAHGLTISEYQILVMLSEAPQRRMRMSELAEAVLSSRSRLTHQIGRMQQAGWVARERCTQDGRAVCAVMTDAGFALLEEAAPTHVAGVRRYLIDVMDDAEIATLGAIVTKMDQALEQQ